MSRRGVALAAVSVTRDAVQGKPNPDRLALLHSVPDDRRDEVVLELAGLAAIALDLCAIATTRYVGKPTTADDVLDYIAEQLGAPTP